LCSFRFHYVEFIKYFVSTKIDKIAYLIPLISGNYLNNFNCNIEATLSISNVY